jgi:hypothetical protein
MNLPTGAAIAEPGNVLIDTPWCEGGLLRGGGGGGGLGFHSDVYAHGYNLCISLLRRITLPLRFRLLCVGGRAAEESMLLVASECMYRKMCIQRAWSSVAPASSRTPSTTGN